MLGRHRLTLPPPAWWPAGPSGSRFGCLGRLDAAPSGFHDLDVDCTIDDVHISVQVARDSLEEEGAQRPESPPRRVPRSEEELRQEFWEDAGFPTPASQFWERGSSSPEMASLKAAGGLRNGFSLCRDTPVLKKTVSFRRRRGGPSVLTSGLRMPHSPPRMGSWRGPLPPRRVSPAPIIGSFIDKAYAAWSTAATVRPSPSSPPGGDPVVSADATSSEVIAPLEFQSLHESPRGAHLHASNLGRTLASLTI